ncbi:Uracil-DNA glycosylase [Penicillium cosmopolitanum]|uniref:Uracil-DNA glycosylase n=1 Tax=Penicillium cosmopolitanum TaxID=1131564 RepID=A0A9X0B416_9EURO|nr:Uracil-DNA glycosylase [Penicillium cosmopolitanum]KAJ5387307.1 Uracil-DNA glycosylase [Penicillium cosmopolitanum]
MVSPALKRKADNSASSPADSKKPKGGSITSFFGAPKPKPANTQSGNASSPPRPTSFNKEKWVASLKPEQKELLQLEIDTLDESWLAHLKDEIVTPEFLNLKRFLKKEKDSKAKVFPRRKMFTLGPATPPLHKVKVVIVGQDPYHNDNQAHGLAFSVRPPTRAPPSLANIYKEIKKEYPTTFTLPPNNGGLLIPWAERGVLMLNTCLTVRAHQANSHSNKGWERFTQRAIDLVARVRTHGVVFLAWGNPAAARVAKIQRDRHCVLLSKHPSPLSAHGGFFGNNHFIKCNEWLASRYGDDEIIDWALVPGTSTKEIKEDVATSTSDKENSSSLANASPSGTKTEAKVPDTNAKCSLETLDKGNAKSKANAEVDEFDDEDALEALIEAEKNSSPVGKA